jgi:hypothetical protein
MGGGVPWKPIKKRHKKKRKPKTPVRRPTPTATPSPSPTATPRAPTLQQVLTTGVAPIHGMSAAGTPPTFSWQPLDDASRYLVVVAPSEGSPPLWTWSGGARELAYGDTELEGLQGTAGDAWTIPPPDSYIWSVVALDAQGRVVGMANVSPLTRSRLRRPSR